MGTAAKRAGPSTKNTPRAQAKWFPERILELAAMATAHEVHRAWKQGGAEALKSKKVADLQHAAHLLAGAAKNINKQACIDAFVAWAEHEQQRASE